MPNYNLAGVETLRPTDGILSKTAFGGLLKRQMCWGLSARGWLLAFALLSLGSVVLLRTVYPFLAVTRLVDSDVLVVEGWLQDYAMRAAAAEFARKGYRQIYTTGGPIAGSGGYTNDYNTAASVGADRLRAANVPGERVQMVPSRVMNRDRTYGAAVALRDYFRVHQISVTRVNVATEAPHARRTRLLFQKALGAQIEVGIIALPNPDYDPKKWWLYSEGVREVIGETLAYFYAKFLFRPA